MCEVICTDLFIYRLVIIVCLVKVAAVGPFLEFDLNDIRFMSS